MARKSNYEKTLRWAFLFVVAHLVTLLAMIPWFIDLLFTYNSGEKDHLLVDVVLGSIIASICYYFLFISATRLFEKKNGKYSVMINVAVLSFAISLIEVLIQFFQEYFRFTAFFFDPLIPTPGAVLIWFLGQNFIAESFGLFGVLIISISIFFVGVPFLANHVVQRGE